MRLAIVHFSDIHVRKAGNPALEATDQLVSAVSSADPSVSLFLVVISGDIAFSGRPLEYRLATKFFLDLKRRLQDSHPGATVEFASVPGNHDCVLPESGVKVRETLIRGIIPSMSESRQDEELLRQLTKAQAPYNRFRKQLENGKAWNGICETRVINHGGHSIQLNLYNTALLSQRGERQGQLHLPIRVLESQISVAASSSLSISIFHHSYLWLESDLAIAFRRLVEKTSDIALMGHQHYSHDFYKENSSGERILYVEAPALQDENYAKTSAFRVLLFDWELQQEKSVSFRRSGDLYRRTSELDWRPLALNRVIRPHFALNSAFEISLNDTGTPLYHPVRGPLKLKDVYVFPNLLVTPAGAKAKPTAKEVLGEDIFSYVSAARRVVFQGTGLAGKTSLAKMLFSEMLRRGGAPPLLLNGRQIRTPNESRLLATIWNGFNAEYSEEMLEHFKQLSRDDRTLIIDDWHATILNVEGRKESLALLGKYFGTILLFTDELFRIHEFIGQSTDTILEFDQAAILEFGHRQRGTLIDKWVGLGREYTVDSRELTRTIEDKERLIQAMIGKNTLPSLPFIVLSLLQADDIDKAEVAEAGSFGYLYEVLVTVALSKSRGPKAQLEKKYIFLARLAYRMFKLQTRLMPVSQVREMAQEYSRDHLVNIDVDAMLSDLEDARVFSKVDGNYGFTYSHFFYYFIARYYRDNLDREASLRKEIEDMVDFVSSDQYSTILMFIVYFARHSGAIVKRLVANADKIYAQELPAELESDVDFLNKLRDKPTVDIPADDVDVGKNRDDRRAFRDKMEQNLRALPDRSNRQFVYDENLADTDKFDLAYRHIGLMGQVIRNFPGSLPGPEKLVILKSTYLLGLRLLRSLLRMLETATGQFRESLTGALEGAKHKVTDEKIRELVDALLVLLSRLCTLSVLKRISGSVGVADLEGAYKETLELVGTSSATNLIDIGIKLDHSPEFPIDQIRSLHRAFAKNAFADTVLADLVTAHIMVFDVDRRIRQSMASIFKFNADSPLLVDPTRKKS
jgi:hypothetical protein